VSAAGFSSAVAQGGLGTIFGTALTTIDGVVSAPSFPLPTELAGTSVWINGKPVPLLAVAKAGSQEQINFQVPWNASDSVMLRRGRAIGILIYPPIGNFPVPSVFGSETGGTPAVVHGADNSLVTESKPAQAGETIVFYATGYGAVNPVVPEGVAAPISPLSSTVSPAAVIFNGIDGIVRFAGLTPGYAGLYQVNVVVPPVPPGTVTVSLGIVLNDGRRSYSSSVKINVE